MIWQTLLDGLGSILAFFYQVIPSYGVAIILLTILVRVVLLPLTIKQTRSMQAMQKIQPKVKELQRKHKGNRQKLNEEMMKLYKEHQVNPLGGCLPLVLQLPVFFALFSVLRSPIEAVAVASEPVSRSELRVDEEDAFCSLVEGRNPSPEATAGNVIECEVAGSAVTVEVSDWQDKDGGETRPSGSLSTCQPQFSGEGASEEASTFLCQSVAGTRNLPEESDLYAAVVEDQATFLGMHLACSPTQAASDEGIRLCASPGTPAGGPALIGYWGLVALMVGSTFYQQRQMAQASAGPQAQQMKLMGRIMPVFLGVISISISAGVLVYWVTTNLWQIGQQYVMLRTRDEGPEPKPAGDGRAKADGKPSPKSGGSGQRPTPDKSSKPKGPGARRAGSRKKRRKR